jgi:isopropylmalate/homocitrate/citramalate synthase
VGSYDITENDSLKSYQLKSSGKNLVKYLIIRQKSDGQEEISAQIKESNYLYESEKNLQAVFENKKLKSYQIEGFQKVILGEKKPYKIVGEIL